MNVLELPERPNTGERHTALTNALELARMRALLVELEAGQILAAVEQNRARRETAELEREAASRELDELLVQGQAAGVAGAELARVAGMTRQAAHIRKLLATDAA